MGRWCFHKDKSEHRGNSAHWRLPSAHTKVDRQWLGLRLRGKGMRSKGPLQWTQEHFQEGNSGPVMVLQRNFLQVVFPPRGRRGGVRKLAPCRDKSQGASIPQTCKGESDTKECRELKSSLGALHTYKMFGTLVPLVSRWDLRQDQGALRLEQFQGSHLEQRMPVQHPCLEKMSAPPRENSGVLLPACPRKGKVCWSVLRRYWCKEGHWRCSTGGWSWGRPQESGGGHIQRRGFGRQITCCYSTCVFFLIFPIFYIKNQINFFLYCELWLKSSKEIKHPYCLA